MNRYFYIDSEGKQKGTFSPDELIHENVKRETLVWTQGMDQWMRAGEVAELSHIFSGTFIAQGAAQPQAPYTHPVMSQTTATQQPMPKTWLLESILVTVLPFILCSSFLSLLGIIGIVYAAQVESFFIRGDYTASAESSRAAGKWTKIALWIAIGWILLIIVTIILVLVFVGSVSGIGAGIGEWLNT